MASSSSWADEIEQGDRSGVAGVSAAAGSRPSILSAEVNVVGNTKTVTLYRVDDKGRKVRVTRTYRIEKRLVPRAVARRRALAKFGEAAGDGPGPNPATTETSTKPVYLQFVANIDEAAKDAAAAENDFNNNPLVDVGHGNVVKCRYCKEDHWSRDCPYQDALSATAKNLDGEDRNVEESTDGDGCKYVPPGLRGQREGEKMPDGDADDTVSLRVSNLSSYAGEDDLRALFGPFGTIARVHVATYKRTEEGRGFGFVHFFRKSDAAKAVATLDGFGYDHLILEVDFAN